MALLRYADAQADGSRRRGLARPGTSRAGLGKAARNDARDVRASAGYWRNDYAAIAPKHDANGVITEPIPAILLLTANVAFRATPGELIASTPSAASTPSSRATPKC